jgi:hypothetical protein
MLIAENAGLTVMGTLGSASEVASMQTEMQSLASVRGDASLNVGTTGTVDLSTMMALSSIAGELPGIPGSLRAALEAFAAVAFLPPAQQQELATQIEAYAPILIKALRSLITDEAPPVQTDTTAEQPYTSERERFVKSVFTAERLPGYTPPKAAIPEPLVIDIELHKEKPFFRIDNPFMWGLLGLAVIGTGVGVRALKKR